VSMLRAAYLIARKDLRIEVRGGDALALMGALALATVFAFAFTLGERTMNTLAPERLIPPVLWTALAFASLVGFRQGWAHEAEHDALSGLRLAPVDRSAIYLGKLAAALVLVLVLEAILVPVSGVIFGADLIPIAGPLTLVLLLHSYGLCAAGTFLGALVNRLGRGESLAAILLLPVAVPILISAGKCTSAALAGRPLGEVRFWMVLAGCFAAVITALAVVLFEPLLEE